MLFFRKAENYFTVSTTQKKTGNIVSLLLGLEKERVVWPKLE